MRPASIDSGARGGGIEVGGMVDDPAGGALFERRAQRTRQRQLGQRAAVDEDVPRLDRDDDPFVAGDPEVGAHGERGGAEARRRDREFEHLVEPRRRLPLDRLLDQLEIEMPIDEFRQHARGAQELVDRHVDVLAIARVEDYLLRVALDVADAEVVAERPGHFPRFTQSASVFHSGSPCDSQCLPPGWNSVPPASWASGITSNRLLSGTPGSTKRDTASKFLRVSSSV